MPSEVKINGFWDPQFKKVKELFAENFTLFEEIGASLAATLNGKYVIDIWAGYADEAKTREWNENTIVCVFSTTKIMASLCMLKLTENGQLDLDEPICKYWPEFGKNGKEKITTRQVLGHTSGLADWDNDIPLEILPDWKKMVELIEIQTPMWEPGKEGGYHALSFGFILGEIVYRINGISLGTYFKKHIANPLNADFHIGLPEKEDVRMAEIVPPYSPFVGDLFEKDSIIYKILGIPGGWNLGGDMTTNFVRLCNSRKWREVEFPSTNGCANARSVAKVGSMVACGGIVDNQKILSPSTLNEGLKEQFNGNGHLFIDGIRYGTGFGLPSTTKPIKNPNTLYWGGWGGSVSIMDMDDKLSISYVMNKMRTQTPEETRNNKFASDTRANRLVSAIYDALNN